MKAIEDVRECHREPTPGPIVAALTFRFSTAMFGKEYETPWQTTLHRIGRRPDGKGLTRKTGWLSPAAAEWCAARSRFPQKYDRRSDDVSLDEVERIGI